MHKVSGRFINYFVSNPHIAPRTGHAVDIFAVTGTYLWLISNLPWWLWWPLQVCGFKRTITSLCAIVQLSVIMRLVCQLCILTVLATIRQFIWVERIRFIFIQPSQLNLGLAVILLLLKIHCLDGAFTVLTKSLCQINGDIYRNCQYKLLSIFALIDPNQWLVRDGHALTLYNIWYWGWSWRY